MKPIKSPLRPLVLVPDNPSGTSVNQRIRELNSQKEALIETIETRNRSSYRLYWGTDYRREQAIEAAARLAIVNREIALLSIASAQINLNSIDWSCRSLVNQSTINQL